MAYKEKRREGRFRVNMPCVVNPGDSMMSITDISLNGLCIIGRAKYNLYDKLDIAIDADGVHKIFVNAVIRNHTDTDECIRYGLEVIKSTDDWAKMVYHYHTNNNNSEVDDMSYKTNINRDYVGMQVRCDILPYDVCGLIIHMSENSCGLFSRNKMECDEPVIMRVMLQDEATRCDVHGMITSANKHDDGWTYTIKIIGEHDKWKEIAFFYTVQNR